MDKKIIWLDFNDAADQQTEPVMTLDAKELKSRLIQSLSSVLIGMFPAGHLSGNQFSIGDLQGNPGKSLVVELEGPKAGMWIDFATNESGDILDLWAGRRGFDIRRQFPELVADIAQWFGEAPPVPVQQSVRQPQVDKLGPYTAKWDYHDAEGNLIACVYRYDTPDGKEYRPWDVIARKMKAPNPRPLYNQPGLINTDDVILVEGEKAADALIKLGIVATTAMNGANAPVDKTDWSPLKGKRVLIWPDKDKAGWEYAERVRDRLQQNTLSSVAILEPPVDKPEKWDAADAVEEGMDVAEFIQTTKTHSTADPEIYPAFGFDRYEDDERPTPPDLIAPRVLTPRGLLIFGGAPKIGKSDFLITLLAYMAAGMAFLGMTPPRPLRVFFLQTELEYFYLRDRLKAIPLPDEVRRWLRKNFIITPQIKVQLDEVGVRRVAKTIKHHFPDEPVDIIVIDPLRNVFVGGDGDASENDNLAMMKFLQERIDHLRELVNPSAGIVLAHHTRKISAKLLQEEPFQALSGASSLRGYYTSGMVMYRPNENDSIKRIDVELRNGPAFGPLYVDKVDGCWTTLEQRSDRLTNQSYGAKLDAERLRKGDVILQTIYSQAAEGRAYTISQFAETFENMSGLGGIRSIQERLGVLATKGHVKFFQNGREYGLPALGRSKFGYLCVEDMALPGTEKIDAETGEVTGRPIAVLPTHYKCAQTGAALPVENPDVWVYQDETEQQ